MKNRSSKKKLASKKTPSSGKITSPTTSKGHLVNKQPQSKLQAAVANGMFLYTDDAWSLRYFDLNDLHFKERELFG